MLGLREPVQCLDFEDPWPLPGLEELEPWPLPELEELEELEEDEWSGFGPEEWVGLEKGPLPVTVGPPLAESFEPLDTLWWG